MKVILEDKVRYRIEVFGLKKKWSICRGLCLAVGNTAGNCLVLLRVHIRPDLLAILN